MPKRRRYAYLTLDALDVRAYECFAVSSHSFWSSRATRGVVLGFFEQLRRVRSTGFLVSHSKRVCTEAAKRHGITCVLSRHFNSSFNDAMMSMERWHVIRHFLTNRQAIAFAGADVRFSRPVRLMLTAALGAGTQQLDAAFEAAVSLPHGPSGGGTVRTFTPDIILAYPTFRMAAFVSEPVSQACR